MAVVFARLFPGMLVRSQENESVNIQWRVPREQVRTVREQLDFEGEVTGDPATKENSRGLPLIYIFVGIVAIDKLARTLLDLYRNFSCPGAIIVRSENHKLFIENDPMQNCNLIIIKQEDGNIEIINREQDNPSTIDLTKILEGLYKK